MSADGRHKVPIELDRIQENLEAVEAMLYRIATDPRGSVVWEFAASHPVMDTEFAASHRSHPAMVHFFIAVIFAWFAAHTSRNYRKRLADIENAISAIDLLTRPVDTFVGPDTVLELRSTKTDLEHDRQDLIAARDRDTRSSRKRKTSNHTVFVKELGSYIEVTFGRPHDEMVAVVANILFETKDGGVGAEAVKMARHRAKRRGQTLTR